MMISHDDHGPVCVDGPAVPVEQKLIDLDKARERHIVSLHAPDTAATFGSLLVLANMWMESIAIGTGDREDLLDAQDYYTNELNQARQALENVLTDRKDKIEKSLGLVSMPVSLRNMLELKPGDSALSALTAKDEDGQYLVQDGTFINVLDWHNYRLPSERRGFAEKEAPVLKQKYFESLQKAVTEGRLPEVVISEERLKRVERTKILIDDRMQTIEDGCLGFATQEMGEDKPAIAVLEPDNSNDHFHHELTHVIEGIDTVPYSHSKSRRDTGLYRLFNKRNYEAGVILNEAVVEHVAQVMISYAPENVSYWKGSYQANRRLLNALCTEGKQPIPISLFINAHFEDGHNKHGGSSAIRELKKSIRRAFPGQDILGRIGDIQRNIEPDNRPDAIVKFSKQLEDARMKKLKASLNTAQRKLDRYQRKANPGLYSPLSIDQKYKMTLDKNSKTSLLSDSYYQLRLSNALNSYYKPRKLTRLERLRQLISRR